MCKVFVDTNVLYELLGINHNCKVNTEHFNEYINSLDKVYIPSVSIGEILVHFRNDDSKLIEILKFIGDSKFEVVKSKYFSFDGHYDMFNLTNEIMIQSNLKNFKLVIDKFLEIKVNEESDFMLLFYKISTLHIICLVIHLFEDNLQEQLILLRYFKEVIDIRIAINSQIFSECLTEGYKNNKEAIAARHSFDVSLIMSIEFIIYSLEHLHEYRGKVLSLKHKKLLKKFKKFFNENAKKQPLKILNWLEKKYIEEKSGTENYDKLEVYTDMFKDILKSHKISNYYVDYIERMFNKWRVSGNKLEKNDIWDMVVLMSLDDPNSILIVFDDNNYEFLKEKVHKSIEIIDMFYNK